MKADWRPITCETTPKGCGTRVIAWDPEYWGKDCEGKGMGTMGEARWIGISDRWQLMRNPGDTSFNPTLWTPMPDDPE